MTQGANFLHFWYDAAGKPALVEWNNGTTSEKYAYLHNQQGDIVGIIDSTGVEVVKYTYDAWGKILSTTGTLANTLGKINPFRYRGYVYDEETGLYYLRSRYYNSAWCRFINADIHLGIWGELLSHSLYSYCQNSPIVYLDFDGNVRLYGVEIAYYGFFHRIVQDSIIELNPGIEKEQHPSPNSKSRIDLKLGNEIYEIKPNNSVSSLLGMKQLGGYLAEGEGELILGTTSLVLPEYSPMIVGDWCITLDVEQKGALISYSVNAEKRGKINSQEAPVISKDQKPVLNNARKVVQMFLSGVAVGFGLGYAQRYGGAGKGVTCACFGF